MSNVEAILVKLARFRKEGKEVRIKEAIQRLQASGMTLEQINRRLEPTPEAVAAPTTQNQPPRLVGQARPRSRASRKPTKKAE